MKNAQGRRTVGHDDIGHGAQQVRDGSLDSLDITSCPAIVDPNIAAGCPGHLPRKTAAALDLSACPSL
jgi:hypothetical protein